MTQRTVEEARWLTAVEAAAFGVWDLDPRLGTVHYSPAWKSRLGFPHIDAPDNTWFWRCRVHPHDFAPMANALRAHLAGDTPSYEARFRLRVNGSGYRTVLSRGRVVANDPQGHPTRMLGTMVDLTDRPVAGAARGLAAELLPSQAPQVHRLPFHALLGAAHQHSQTGGWAIEPYAATPKLVDLVADLLDRALREGQASRLRAVAG